MNARSPSLSILRTPAQSPIHMMHLAQIEDAPKHTQARCSNCSLRGVCLPADLSPTELEQVDDLVCATRHVRRGEALFRTQDHFQSLYAVRTGSFKTGIMHREGHEQITGFHIPGDSLGLDGISSGSQSCEAVALEDSTVCVIPFGRLETVCGESRRMQRHLYHLLSAEIVRESGLMMMLGTMTAEQRLASFLLDLAARFRLRGYSGAQFNLKMSRDEIGGFLGIKLETVSRMFSRFQREGLVKTKGRQIQILDAEKLAQV